MRLRPKYLACQSCICETQKKDKGENFQRVQNLFFAILQTSEIRVQNLRRSCKQRFRSVLDMLDTYWTRLDMFWRRPGYSWTRFGHAPVLDTFRRRFGCVGHVGHVFAHNSGMDFVCVQCFWNLWKRFGHVGHVLDRCLRSFS